MATSRVELQVNCTLASLDLKSNDLGPEGTAIIADALKVATWRARAAAEYRIALHEYEQVNQTLTSIDLSFINASGRVVAAIADALKVLYLRGFLEWKCIWTHR